MMDHMRRMATGFVAKILIGLLAMSFAVWGIHDIFRGWSGTTLLTVGDEKVEVATFQNTLNQQLRQLSRQTGQAITPEMARQFGLDRQILGQLARDATLTAEAKALDLAIPEDLIVQDVANNPSFRGANGKFDPNLFRRLLSENGFSEQMFMAAESANRQRQLLAMAVSGNFTAPRSLIEAAFHQINDKRDVRYFVVKGDESKIALPDDATLQKFHDDNQALFTAPDYRSVAMILVEPENLAPAISLTDAEVADAYDRRKDEYGTPETRDVLQMILPNEEEAQKIVDALNSGKDFMALASERGLKDADVKLGNISKGQIADPAIAEAVFKTPANNNTGIIKTRLAYAVLHVSAITPGNLKPLEEVRADVEAKLRLDKAKDEVLVIHDKIEDARAGGATFEEIAKDMNLTFSLVAAVDANGRDRVGNQVAGMTAPVVKAAFETDIGVENDPVPTPTDGFAWIEVREIIPSALLELSQVREKALDAWKQSELAKLAATQAKQLQDRAEKGESFDALAQAQSASIETISDVSRTTQNANLSPAALAAIFRTPDNGVGAARMADGVDMMIFATGPITSTVFDPETDAAKNLSREISRSAAGDLFGLYIGALQKRLGVDVNPELWNQVSGASN